MNDEVWTHGYNSCLHVAISALNHLSSHPRPSGGQEAYNAEHLLQIADEIKRTIAHNVKAAADGAPAQGRLDPKGEMTKIAAECHRAKWQFDLSEDFQPSKSAARALILQAFHELHRIGDLAIKARDAYTLTSTDRS